MNSNISENKILEQVADRAKLSVEKCKDKADKQQELLDAKEELIRVLKKELAGSRDQLDALQSCKSWKFGEGFLPDFRSMCYDVLALNVSAQAAPKVIQVLNLALNKVRLFATISKKI
jgi:hypothetical protein